MDDYLGLQHKGNMQATYSETNFQVARKPVIRKEILKICKSILKCLSENFLNIFNKDCVSPLGDDMVVASYRICSVTRKGLGKILWGFKTYPRVLTMCCSQKRLLKCFEIFPCSDL